MARHPSRNVHRKCRSTTPERHELWAASSAEMPSKRNYRTEEKSCSPGGEPWRCRGGGRMEWRSENGEELVKMIDRQMFRDEDPPKNMTPTEGQVQTTVSHGHRQQTK